MFSKYYKITHKTQSFLLEYTYSSKILHDVSTTYINTSNISIKSKNHFRSQPNHHHHCTNNLDT